jgi:hypothetical protein
VEFLQEDKTNIYCHKIKKDFIPDLFKQTFPVNPSTPQHKCWGLLRVDPERRFIHRPKGRSLTPPNGSKISVVENFSFGVTFLSNLNFVNDGRFLKIL